MNNEPDTTATQRIESFMGFVALVAQTFAVCVTVFLHKPGSFGQRYMGMQAAAATVLIFFWPVFCEPIHDPRPMVGFLFAYLAMCLVVRICVALRVRRNEPQPHSRYTGWPWLMRYTGTMSEVTVKRVIEPALVWVVGGLCLFISPPLGGFLMMSGLGLLIANGVADGFDRNRALDLHDAQVEQRNVVERFRQLRGD